MSWRTVGVSVQGVGHRVSGLPCQDAQVCRSLSGEGRIIAVADGAGSAPCAAQGSAAAAVAASDVLSGRLASGLPSSENAWRAAMEPAFEAAVEAIQRLAGAARRPAGDFASTLTCAVLAGGWLATGQLGDGLAVARAGDQLFLAARPQRGEYANEAYFLTMDRALDRVEYATWQDPVDALAVSTDGLLRVALRLPECEPFAPFFRPLFDFAAGHLDVGGARRGLLRFLDSPRVCARTDDDKTLVLAVQAPAWGTSATGAPLLTDDGLHGGIK